MNLFNIYVYQKIIYAFTIRAIHIFAFVGVSLLKAETFTKDRNAPVWSSTNGITKPNSISFTNDFTDKLVAVKN